MVRSASTEQVAEHFGVRTGTVREWVRRKGCPSEKPGKELRFNLDEVTRWRETHANANNDGGKRAGAGRKPKARKGAESPSEAAGGGDRWVRPGGDEREPVEAPSTTKPARQSEGDQGGGGRAEAEIAGYRSARGSSESVPLDEAEKLTRAEIDRLKALEQYLAMRLDRLRDEAVLVEVSKVERVYGDRVAHATRMLQDMARSMANTLVTDFGLDPSRASDVRGAIERHVDSVTQAFRGAFASQEGSEQ